MIWIIKLWINQVRKGCLLFSNRQPFNYKGSLQTFYYHGYIFVVFFFKWETPQMKIHRKRLTKKYLIIKFVLFVPFLFFLLDRISTLMFNKSNIVGKKNCLSLLWILRFFLFSPWLQHLFFSIKNVMRRKKIMTKNSKEILWKIIRNFFVLCCVLPSHITRDLEIHVFFWMVEWARVFI